MIHERIRLLENLWDSIASDQNSISLSFVQKVELDKRLEAYETDKNPGRPVDGVVPEIRGKLWITKSGSAKKRTFSVSLPAVSVDEFLEELFSIRYFLLKSESGWNWITDCLAESCRIPHCANEHPKNGPAPRSGSVVNVQQESPSAMSIRISNRSLRCSQNFY